MDQRELAELLVASRDEVKEERRLRLEGEVENRRLSRMVDDLKRQNTELQDRLGMHQSLLRDCDRLRITAEELIARSRRALKTGNSPERVLAELAAILLETSA